MRKNRDKITVSAADMEPNLSYELLGKKKTPRLVTRCSLHLHSRRYRLCDPDGLSAKAVIDGLVVGGLLADDTTKEIKEVRFSQEKIPKSQQEETIITITRA